MHAAGAVRLSEVGKVAGAALSRLAAERVGTGVPLPPPDPALAWLVPRAVLAEGEPLRTVARVGGGAGLPVPPPRVVAVTDRRLLVVEDGEVLHEWALADVAAAGYEQSALEARLLLAVPAGSRYVAIDDGGNGLTVALALQRSGSAPATARTLRLRSIRDGSHLLVAVGLVTGIVATLTAVVRLATGGHLLVAALVVLSVRMGFASARRSLQRPWAPPRRPGAGRRALTLAEEAAPVALCAAVGALVPGALLLAATLVPWALFHAGAATHRDGRL